MIPNIQIMHQEIGKILRLKIPDTNIKILIAEQTNPSYTNWVSFKLTDWVQSGGEEVEFEDLDDPDNANEITKTMWKTTLNIVTIGNLSEQLALTLSHNFNKLSYLDKFELLGLALLSKSGIKPAPRAVGTGWEQRHILNVDFNILISDSDAIDFFDSVEITQEIVNVDDTIIDTSTYTIDLTP